MPAGMKRKSPARTSRRSRRPSPKRISPRPLSTRSRSRGARGGAGGRSRPAGCRAGACTARRTRRSGPRSPRSSRSPGLRSSCRRRGRRRRSAGAYRYLRGRIRPGNRRREPRASGPQTPYTGAPAWNNRPRRPSSGDGAPPRRQPGLDISVAAWAVLGAVVVVMLLVDLCVFGARRARGHRLRVGAAGRPCWLAARARLRRRALGWQGDEAGSEYLAGYLLERSLSLDNLFVFAVLFSYFAVPPAVQPRCSRGASRSRWCCGWSSSCSAPRCSARST